MMKDMTGSNDDKTGDQHEFDESLREEFGLPPLQSEPDAPAVDGDLIRTFVTNGPVSEADLQMVMDYIGRFQEWRDEYTKIVIDNYNRKKLERLKGGSPTPESP